MPVYGSLFLQSCEHDISLWEHCFNQSKYYSIQASQRLDNGEFWFIADQFQNAVWGMSVLYNYYQSSNNKQG